MDRYFYGPLQGPGPGPFTPPTPPLDAPAYEEEQNNNYLDI